MKLVYAAGPITGLSYEEARLSWRKRLAKLLPSNIQIISPMRGKDYLAEETDLKGDSKAYLEHAMSSPKGIVTRDTNDVRTCDIMIANFLNARKVSIGTCIEFGLAHAFNKPIIMVIEFGSFNPHDHAMLVEIAGYVVNDLESAANIAKYLLSYGI